MSTWNHRVVDLTTQNDGEELYAIQEVFYDDDGTLMGYCEPSMVSETMTGLVEILERMADALEQPVLKHEDFVRNKVTDEGEAK